MPAPLPVSIRMPPELKAGLATLAEAERRSFSSYVLLVLEEHLRDRQEHDKTQKPRLKQRTEAGRGSS